MQTLEHYVKQKKQALKRREGENQRKARAAAYKRQRAADKLKK